MNILELPGSSHVGAGMSCSSLWRKLETGTIRDNCVGRFVNGQLCFGRNVAPSRSYASTAAFSEMPIDVC